MLTSIRCHISTLESREKRSSGGLSVFIAVEVCAIALRVRAQRVSQATSDALVLAGRSWSGVVTVTASAWLGMRLESLQVFSGFFANVPLLLLKVNYIWFKITYLSLVFGPGDGSGVIVPFAFKMTFYPRPRAWLLVFCLQLWWVTSWFYGF
ncbi:hypothetical protein TcWFU_002662 [Taenia crassiceps]|uniref:NADH:ubiquinone reductase (H(+)-translocating) n=1 Tax=Taenia crassiceps TaxID=6207 RepID=A0ABR4Q4W0_9CEST